MELFTRFPVEFRFTTRFAAGIPKDPKVLLAFLEARAGPKPVGAQPMEEWAEEVAEEVYAPATGGEAAITTTFKADEKGLYYEARCVKSHLADCLRVLAGKDVQILDVRNAKAKAKDQIGVEPAKIYLYRNVRNGAVLTKPDGSEIRAVTVMTMQGPRTAVKIVEFVESPVLKVELVTLLKFAFSFDELHAALEYGGRIKGMGQDRSQGFGRYEHTCQACPS